MGRFKKLSESPDRISDQDWYKRPDAWPFGYFLGKFYYHKDCNGKTHYDLLEFFLKKGDKNITKYVESEGYLDSTDMKFHGRFWLGSKKISFWDYPDKANFQKVISELKKNGIPINSSWKVETTKEGEFIPIDEYGNEYKGAKKDQELHLMNATEKNKALKNKGVTPGYVMKSSKLPKGMTFAQYHHLTKQESLEEDLPTTVAPSSPATGQFEKKIGEVAKRKMEKEEIKKKIKKKLEENMNHTDKVLKSLKKKAELEGLKHISDMKWKDKDGKTYTYSESNKKFVKIGLNEMLGQFYISENDLFWNGEEWIKDKKKAKIYSSYYKVSSVIRKIGSGRIFDAKNGFEI